MRAAREALKRKRRKRKGRKRRNRRFLSFEIAAATADLTELVGCDFDDKRAPPPPSFPHYVKIPADRESSKIDARAILPAMPTCMRARMTLIRNESASDERGGEQTVQLFCEKVKMQQKRNTPRSYNYELNLFQQVTS